MKNKFKKGLFILKRVVYLLNKITTLKHNIMDGLIKMEDLVYNSEPTNILCKGRSQRNNINFLVKSIERYISSQGSKMVKYVCTCETIYKKEQVFYVGYGLNGDYKNITLADNLVPTTCR